jgi:hypothetical protein
MRYSICQIYAPAVATAREGWMTFTLGSSRRPAFSPAYGTLGEAIVAIYDRAFLVGAAIRAC